MESSTVGGSFGATIFCVKSLQDKVLNCPVAITFVPIRTEEIKLKLITRLYLRTVYDQCNFVSTRSRRVQLDATSELKPVDIQTRQFLRG